MKNEKSSIKIKVNNTLIKKTCLIASGVPPEAYPVLMYQGEEEGGVGRVTQSGRDRKGRRGVGVIQAYNFFQ